MLTLFLIQGLILCFDIQTQYCSTSELLFKGLSSYMFFHGSQVVSFVGWSWFWQMNHFSLWSWDVMRQTCNNTKLLNSSAASLPLCLDRTGGDFFQTITGTWPLGLDSSGVGFIHDCGTEQFKLYKIAGIYQSLIWYLENTWIISAELFASIGIWNASYSARKDMLAKASCFGVGS